MNEKKAPAAVALRDMALKELDLFHSPEEAAYATFPNGATHPVNSEAMRRWLIRKNGGCPSMTTVQAAITAIAAEAIDGRPEQDVFVRLGWLDGCVYLDLKDRFAKISPGKWEVCDKAPVRFLRPNGLLGLPTPVRGGNLLNLLQPLINVQDQDSWVLLTSWPLGCLNPNGAYPILAFHGEKGSGKSSASRYLRSLVDPSTLDTAKTPKDIEALNLRALNSWVVVYDNVASIPQWLSDALCRLSTGAGDSARKLYTDADETLFRYKRPAILNGITEYATQSDLLSRIVSVTLEPVEQRRTEEALERQFDEAQPHILGALLDYATTALRGHTQDQDDWPRMADFAKWVVASGLWERKSFLNVYEQDQKRADWLAIDSSAVGMAVVKLMELHLTWQGTGTELYDALTALANSNPDQFGRPTLPPNWPKTVAAMSNQLMRIAGPLRAVATIDVRRGHTSDHEHNRRFTLTAKSEAFTAALTRLGYTVEQAKDELGPDVYDSLSEGERINWLERMKEAA